MNLKKFTLIMIALICSNYSNAQSWILKAEMNGGRGACQSFTLNNKLYVQGGYVGFSSGYKIDMYMYDPAFNTWTLRNSPSEGNRTGGVAFTINGKAYIALGTKNYLSFSPLPTPLTDVNVFDDVSNSWTIKNAFPDSSREFSASFVINNKAYIVGGSTIASISNEVWEYNPATDVWTQKANLPVPIEATSGFASSTKGYIVGGITTGNIVTSNTYEYNPVSDTWVTKAAFPNATQGGTAFVINNIAYYGMGSDKTLGATGASFPTTFYKYDMAADAWTSASFIFGYQGRLWPISGVINNKAYMGTGYKFQNGEFNFKDFHEMPFAPATINDLDKLALHLYPNPVQNSLILSEQLLDATYKIYNMNGQLIDKGILSTNSIIDVQDIQNGLYSILIQSNKKVYTNTFSILR
jgi:N-acetylneuraminic acid mutarotase